MFRRSAIGVFPLLLPAFLMSMTLWSIPPARAALICYGFTVAMITAD